jgi:general stress protein 26
MPEVVSLWLTPMEEAMEQTDDDKARQRVWELIKDIRTAQLVTHSPDGELSSRPMAAVNKTFDGKLWFLTSSESGKIHEVEDNRRVLLTYSHPSKQQYVSVRGNAQVSNNREMIEALWTEMARIWFPEGKDDPRIRLIGIEVTAAEYWETPGKAAVLLYGYAVARLTGHVPEIGENKIVNFRR